MSGHRIENKTEIQAIELEILKKGWNCCDLKWNNPAEICYCRNYLYQTVTDTCNDLTVLPVLQFLCNDRANIGYFVARSKTKGNNSMWKDNFQYKVCI